MIDKKMMQGPRTMAAFGGIMGKDGRKRFFLGGGGNDSYDIGGGGDPGNTGNSPPSSSNNDDDYDARDTYRASQFITPTPKPAPIVETTRYNPFTDDGTSQTSVVTGDRIKNSQLGFIQKLNNDNAITANQTGTKFTPYQGGSRPKNNFMDTIKKFNPIGLGLGAINPFLGLAYNGFNYLKDKTGIMNNQDFFNENVIGNYGYGKDDYKKYMSGRMSGLTNAYGRTLNEGEVGYGSVGQSSSPIGLFETTQKAGDIVEDQVNDEETIEDIVLRFEGADRTLDPTAAGVANTDELRAMIQERLKKLYT